MNWITVMFMYLCNKKNIFMRVRYLEIIKEQSKKENFSTKTIFPPRTFGHRYKPTF